MTDIDMVAVIGVASTVVGIIVTYFATNARTQRYLNVLQKGLKVGDSYFKGNKDKVWTDEEYKLFGKDMVDFIEEVHNGNDTPAEIESLSGKTL